MYAYGKRYARQRLTRMCAGLAACGTMARFVANDTLRAALLGEACEREALEVAVARLAGVTWDEAEAPGVMWVLGAALTRTHPGTAHTSRARPFHTVYTRRRSPRQQLGPRAGGCAARRRGALGSETCRTRSGCEPL